MPLKKRVPSQKTTGVVGHKKNGTRKVLSYNEYEKKFANQKKKSSKVIKAKKQAGAKPLAKPIDSKEKKAVQPVKKVEPVKKSPTMLQVSPSAQDIKKIAADKKIAEEKKKKADAKKLADKKAADDKKKAALDKQNKKVEAERKLAEQKKADTKKEKIEQEKKKLEKEIEDKNKDTKIVDPEVVKQPEPAQQPEIIQQKVIEELVALETAPVTIENNVLEAASNDVENDDEQDDYIDLDNISFVGSRDLEMMQIKEQIQAEIVKHYKPPVGISKKAVCDASVLVGAGGKATRVTIKKGSGSMANDICARAALLKVIFPKEVIGKEIIIALGQ